MKRNRSPASRKPPPEAFGEIRKSANNGAASLLGRARKDVLDDIAAATVEKYLANSQAETPIPILNIRAWAFKVGQNEARAVLVREQRHVPLELSRADREDGDSGDGLWGPNGASSDERRLVGEREEVLQALPELFSWFQHRVVARLDEEDRLFFERYYLDKWSETQIAAELHISEKSVAQRWRRLLLRLRKSVQRELPKWERGNELFGDAFRYRKSLADLLCLVRLFVEQGIEAVKAIVQSLDRQ
jgi:RNA polymerase sigma factor (sigma-70 family)